MTAGIHLNINDTIRAGLSPLPLISGLLIAAGFAFSLFFHGQDNVLFAPAFLCVLAGALIPLLTAVWRDAFLPKALPALLLFAFWLYVTASLFWSTMPYASLLTWLVFSCLPLLFIALAVSPQRDAYVAAAGGMLHVGLVALGLWAVLQVTLFDGFGSRAAHPMINANNLASILNLGLLPLVAVCLALRGRGWLFYASLAGALILFAGLLMTESRGGFISFVIGFMLLLVVMRQTVFTHWRRTVAIILLFTALFTGADLTGHSNTGQRLSVLATAPATDHAAMARPAIWTATLEMIRDRPLAGSGFGTFYQQYGAYRTPDDRGSAGQWAHMDPLQYAAEMGIAAPLLFYAFVLSLAWFVARRMPRDGEARALIAGPLAALAAILAHAHVSYPLYLMPVIIIGGVWLAAIYGRSAGAADWSRLQADTAQRRSTPSFLVILIATLLAVPAITAAMGTWYVGRAKEAIEDGRPQTFLAMLDRAERWGPASFADPHVYRAGLYIDLLRAPYALLNEEEQADTYRMAQLYLDHAAQLAPAWAEVDYKRAALLNTVRDRYEPDWMATATGHLVQALAKDKRHFRARKMLADLYMEQARMEEAYELLWEGARYPHDRQQIEQMRAAIDNLRPLVEIRRQTIEELIR